MPRRFAGSEKSAYASLRNSDKVAIAITSWWHKRGRRRELYERWPPPDSQWVLQSISVAVAVVPGASRRLGCVLRLDRDRCFALSQRSSSLGERWTPGQHIKTAFRCG